MGRKKVTESHEEERERLKKQMLTQYELDEETGKNVYYVYVEDREDGVPGSQFYCPWCDKVHMHSPGLCHKDAHCTHKSPYWGGEDPDFEEGYILKKKEEE